MNFHSFKAQLFEAFSPTLFTMEWLEYQVLQGNFLHWNTDKAAILCQIRTYPTGVRIIHGIAACGDLTDIIETLIPIAEKQAAKEGCIGAVIESRWGWKKALQARGYEEDKIALRKLF